MPIASARLPPHLPIQHSTSRGGQQMTMEGVASCAHCTTSVDQLLQATLAHSPRSSWTPRSPHPWTWTGAQRLTGGPSRETRRAWNARHNAWYFVNEARSQAARVHVARLGWLLPWTCLGPSCLFADMLRWPVSQDLQSTGHVAAFSGVSFTFLFLVLLDRESA